MRRTAKVAAVVAGGVVLGGISASSLALSGSALASTAARTSSPLAGRYIPEHCARGERCIEKAYRPSTFVLLRWRFTIDDVGARITGIHWTQYNRTTARGTGTAYLLIHGGGKHECTQIPVPCTSNLGHVVIVFSRPRGSGTGWYTRVHMTGQRTVHQHTLAHWWRFKFSGAWGIPGLPGWVNY